jgi:flavin reductase (DIM6/NTAB) family NADH-FMN oxidoreductase RutF
MAERMNQTSFAYPYGVDEFDKAGFTRLPSERIKPPRVAESPVQLECRLHQLVRHGAGALASNYLIGEVLVAHAAEQILTDDWPDNTKLEYIARLGEDWYAQISPASLFPLPRPQAG